MRGRRSAALIFFAAFLAIVHAAQPAEQSYPVRPIRMLVPVAPGGATDIIARVLEPTFTRRIGQQIVIDDRSGAAGNIAVELVAQSQPDGYTLLVGNISTNSIDPLLFAGRMKVNALKDLAPHRLVAIPNFILGSPKLPASTLKEALAYTEVAAGPAQLSGTPGFLLSSRHAGVDCGGRRAAGASAVERRGRNIVCNVARRYSHHRIERRVEYRRRACGADQGVCRYLEQRLVEMPEVPTMAEAGFPGVGSLNWNGLFAPARTPRTIVNRLHATTIAAMKELDAEGSLTKRALPVSLSAAPEEFATFVAAEAKRWDKIIRENNVKID